MIAIWFIFDKINQLCWYRTPRLDIYRSYTLSFSSTTWSHLLITILWTPVTEVAGDFFIFRTELFMFICPSLVISTVIVALLITWLQNKHLMGHEVLCYLVIVVIVFVHIFTFTPLVFTSEMKCGLLIFSPRVILL